MKTYDNYIMKQSFFTILFAAIFGCMTPIMAQNNVYTERLDSIVSQYEKITFTYDDLNCIQIVYYSNEGYEWMPFEYLEYTYDEFGRIATFISTRGTQKEEYSYNDQNQLLETIISTRLSEEDEWELDERYVYEYDDDGNMTLEHGFLYLGDGWSDFTQRVYEYEEGLLRVMTYSLYVYAEGWTPWDLYNYSYDENGRCVEMITSLWDEEQWHENDKYVYEYDDNGNRIRETVSDHYLNDEWVYSSKREFEYDVNHNCTAIKAYQYSNGWNDHGYINYTYDLSTPVEETTGIMMVWNEELPIYNKVMSCEERNGALLIANTFYYTGYMDTDENNVPSFSIWPNPVGEVLNLSSDNIRQMEIYSIDGKLVMTKTNAYPTINVSSLPAGCYLLKAVMHDGRIITQRFVK